MLFKFIDQKMNRLDYDRDQVKKILYIVIASLSALALILGVICAVGYFGVRRSTVEAGTVLTAAELTGDKDAYFCGDFDPENLNHPGTYYIKVASHGKETEICVTVVDTKAPEVTVKNIKWPLSEKIRAPRPEDFIDSIIEADGYKGEFVEPLGEFKSLGEYSAKIRFTDPSGNKTKVFSVTLKLVSDSEPPKVKALAESVVIKLGTLSEESGSDLSVYYDVLEITDNCAGEIRLEIDDSEVDYGKAGKYPVYVTATDMIGNKSEKVSVTVEIVEVQQN